MALDVRLTPNRSKHALSITTEVVSGLISELSPPMMPARATGLRPSHIINALSGSLRSTSSRVTKVCPGSVRRTTIFRSSCSGCPHSMRSKFVASTTLEIGRIPDRLNRSRTSKGEGPMVTPSTIVATYRGQRSASGTSTESFLLISPDVSCRPTSGRAHFLSARAATSLAVPRIDRQSPRLGVTAVVRI